MLGFLRLLRPAGAETTYRLAGNVLFALLTHPERRAEVAASPALLSDLIEETLRWDSPVQIISREATRDVDLHGYRIPKGDLACFAIGSANREERHYDDPDRFDLHRPDKNDHLSFGLGAHYCLGAHLARTGDPRRGRSDVRADSRPPPGPRGGVQHPRLRVPFSGPIARPVRMTRPPSQRLPSARSLARISFSF